jgi:DNA (cytosine-5)-methyltransferase 1
MSQGRIPIVDLFAGPGGLGEGFSAVRNERGDRVFDIRVSIEKDPVAHQTLTLRALYRALEDDQVPDSYYQYIRGEINRATFFADPAIAPALEHAKEEAQCMELGNDPKRRIDKLIRSAVDGHEDWVLIGGPPCQAYSVAGRSRRRSVDPKFEDDPKHFLYKEYLRIIREFKPAVFVMENVKGMLSSTHNGLRIFERIINDLSEPAPGVLYDIRSFVVPSRPEGLNPEEFTIQSENFGVPQMRHRVILLGVRADRAGQTHDLLTPRAARVTVRDALVGMPSIRSKLSVRSGPDSPEAWLEALREAVSSLKGWKSPIRQTIESLMEEAAQKAERLNSAGGSFISKEMQKSRSLPDDLASWFHDEHLGGVCQHEARSHMRSDLHRYIFASCYGNEYGYAPKLGHFPPGLLPAHKNIEDESIPFDDRFRVQVYRSPSTTVVSHIAKDGHYYIHPDPSQCRSLTVREAARLQTFPDNYFFEGNRTEQYHQVGNAVPPFLAKQLGESVSRFLLQPERITRRTARQNNLFAES